MSDVHFSIAGRSYDVHCEDGQEAQLLRLAARVDEKARAIQGGTEVRQLLFAALMLADEAQEALARVEKAEPQADSLRAAVALAESREAQAREELRAALAERDALKAAAVESAAPRPRGAHDRALLQIADRMEALARKVEQMS